MWFSNAVFVASTPREPALPSPSAKAGSVGQSRDRRAQMRLRRVPEFHDERVVLERVLDDATLHAFAASVNQPHLTQARFMRSADVLLDDRRDVSRRERVEIDRVFDGNLQMFD